MAAAALAVLAFGGGWLTWSLHRGTAAHYVTQQLERGSVVRTVTASGVVSPTATAPVGARVSGVIQALYCDANIKVKMGQLCAKIDPHPYQIVVDKNRAGLAASRGSAREGPSGSRPGESVHRGPGGPGEASGRFPKSD
jgi:multidrug efflux pump subunit AcrA (membrane-fusion protein)